LLGETVNIDDDRLLGATRGPPDFSSRRDGARPGYDRPVAQQPLDPGVVDMGVFIAYASTMLAVQVFERNLAVLVLAFEANPWRSPREVKSPEHFRSFLGKLIAKSVNTFHKATARQLRNRLPAEFDCFARRKRACGYPQPGRSEVVRSGRQ
jgi:hypothetical protein